MRLCVVTTVALIAAVATPALATVSAPGRAAPLLVQLRPHAVCTGAEFLARAGAVQVAPPLRLWRVPPGAPSGLLARLRRADAVAFAEPERGFAGAAVARVEDAADPLVPDEWWRATIGIQELTPPGPGVPVTIVDSGVDFSHEEFAARANLVAVNPQEPAGVGGRHGTMVASVIGAPVNGVGLVGVYPEAVLHSYDAAVGDGTTLTTTEIVNGILTAAEAGKSVINLSLGGASRSLSIEEAVFEAVRRGALVVAASGNDGAEGNPLEYPAAVPHVLTVAATDRTDAAAPFSSRSGYVDLAAPGVDIPVARPATFGPPYTVESGTSFAAPIVSASAAWLWTLHPELDATQIAEMLRRTARDVDAPGWDSATGYGIVNVPALLAATPPAPDTREPNDDIGNVDPTADAFSGFPPLTTPVRTAAGTAGRLTRFDDPRDVYRVWLPRDRAVTFSVASDRPATLQLFRQGLAQTAVGAAAIPDRLATIGRPTADGSLAFANKGPGRIAFVAIGMPRGGGRDIAYTLDVKAG